MSYWCVTFLFRTSSIRDLIPGAGSGTASSLTPAERHLNPIGGFFPAHRHAPHDDHQVSMSPTSPSPTISSGSNPHNHPRKTPDSDFAVTGRHKVGSQACTKASTARRAVPPLWFCRVPGCTSNGFTTKHNLKCKFWDLECSLRSQTLIIPAVPL
ncbi:hypothetical protein V5O48_008176 [Marasmius crinis-equi]|uniref:Uncharacterized protein n=1 Tax=Marasmius crinis-equi TaxID=585013 RepID=A0ABR3FEM5_9AGAR